MLIGYSFMKIPSAKVHIPNEDIEFILKETKKILKSGFFILGKNTERFEKEFAKFIGTKYAVATNNGTSALEISLRALNIKNKEIIVPTNTNFATPAAVLYAGGKLRFIDADPKTFSIKLKDVKKTVNENTKGIVIVHIGGTITPEIEKISKFCKENDLFLLEDGAHAHGSAFHGKKAGNFGTIGAFSFYPTKVMTSGEGGMIVTNSFNLHKEALYYRDQGKINFGKNYHIRMGNSWRMGEVNAVIGTTQLKRLPKFIQHRKKIAHFYDQKLSNTKRLELIIPSEGSICNYYKYILLLDKNIAREKLKEIMREKFGVSLSGEVYEIPCHLQPVFKGKFKGESFKNAEEICARHICLPISAATSLKEANHVVFSLKKALKMLLR